MKPATSLLELVTEELQTGETALPVLHPVAARLHQLLAEDEVDIAKVVSGIEQDQALAGQVLRVANSAFFVGLRKASTIHDAVMRLGCKRVTALVLLVTQRQCHRSQSPDIYPYMKTLWKHSLGCANGTHWLAHKLGYSELAPEAFLAGLFHDIGKLFLLKVLENVQQSKTCDIDLDRVLVLDVLETLHAEQGYLLLRKWNLPEAYCEVARQHHAPSVDPHDLLLVMVRLADAACKRAGLSHSPDPSLVLAALPEVQVLDVKEVVLAELEIAIEDSLHLDGEEVQ